MLKISKCRTIPLNTNSSSIYLEIVTQQNNILNKLTTHAACTASDTLPALGSHQNTWHWKCWLPVSIMKANVCTSRPTPMKDKKRTRHSTNTSSSSSCTHSQEENQICAKPCSIRSSPLIDKHLHIFYLSVTPQDSSKKSLTFSLMTASVVSAMLSMTGVQSSLPVEDMRVSMAPFMMSIPEDKRESEQLGCVTGVITGRRMCCDVCMGFSISPGLPMGRDTDVIPRYSTWNFCTNSVFGMGNSAERKHTHIKTHTHTQIARRDFDHTTTSNAQFQKRSPHMIIGLNLKSKQTLVNILILKGAVDMIRAWKTYSHTSIQDYRVFCMNTQLCLFTQWPVGRKDCHTQWMRMIKDVVSPAFQSAQKLTSLTLRTSLSTQHAISYISSRWFLPS